MSDGLRLMIFDDTDRTGAKRQLEAYAPDVLDARISDLGVDYGLTHTWLAGGWFYRMFGRFDYTHGFSDWESALTWLCDVEPERQIDEIQFWGHGSPGAAWMARYPLTKNAFEDSRYATLLGRLKTRLTEDSLFWFRSCAIFCGQPGHDFASAWSESLGCRIAAHTHIVHILQSGLYCLDPGMKPWWSRREGIISGSVDFPMEVEWGGLFTPRTILAIDSTLPLWASVPDY